MTMTSNTAYAADEGREVPEWELCDRLRRTLRMIPLGVSEIAEILDVNRNTVGAWLNGHNGPKRSALMWWADAANVPLEWLETGQTPAGRPGPAGSALYAIRDSNPEPADWYLPPALPVKATLTQDRRGDAGRGLSVGQAA